MKPPYFLHHLTHGLISVNVSKANSMKSCLAKPLHPLIAPHRNMFYQL